MKNFIARDELFQFVFLTASEENLIIVMEKNKYVGVAELADAHV